MSTETRDALREALGTALCDATMDEPGLDEVNFDLLADLVLAHPAMVAALRATDVPVAEGLDDVPLYLLGVTPTRTFRLTSKADFDWLADYFSGYHGVPGLRAALAALARPEPDA